MKKYIAPILIGVIGFSLINAVDYRVGLGIALVFFANNIVQNK